jgi:type IV secretion system protein VirD4
VYDSGLVDAERTVVLLGRWYLMPRNRRCNVYVQTLASSQLLNYVLRLDADKFVELQPARTVSKRCEIGRKVMEKMELSYQEAFDPTMLARTPQLALTLAEGLLDSAAAGHTNDSLAVWASYATLPLAGLLYAARRDNLGIGWVLDAAVNTDRDVPATTPGWASAAQRVADTPMLATALTRTVNMDVRQRDSVAKTVLDALAAWTPPRGRSVR